MVCHVMFVAQFKTTTHINARKTWWKLFWNVAFGTKIECCNCDPSSLWWVFDRPIKGAQAGALGRGGRDVGMSRHDNNDRWMAKNEYRYSNAGLTRSIKYQETLNQYLISIDIYMRHGQNKIPEDQFSREGVENDLIQRMSKSLKSYC